VSQSPNVSAESSSGSGSSSGGQEDNVYQEMLNEAIIQSVLE